jgi:drug/metabolite transporter (DMT)-like permease
MERTDTLDGARPGTASGRWGAAPAVALPALFVLLWSSAFIAAVIGLGAVSPLLLTCLRFTVAGLLIAGLALVTRRRWPRGRQLAHVAVSGLFMQALQFGGLYSAIGAGLPSGLVALVQGLNPAVIAMLAAPVLGERIRGRQWLGFGIGALGVLVAVSDQWGLHPGAVLCAGLGLLGLGGGTVYQKRFVSDMDVLAGTSVQFLAGAPVLGVAALLLEQPRVSNWAAFGAALAWIVLVNSVGTFVLLNVMLRRGDASQVGALFFLTPGVTALLSWLAVGSTLSPRELAGLALGGVGVLLAAGRSRRSGAGLRRPPVSGASPSAARSASSRPAASGPSAWRPCGNSAR